ncbi:MAG: phosphoribosylanthranilate isomerase [Pseudomonadota bacterium]
MTRVKICGITRPEDALAAAVAGADAIGLVFYPPSPRHIAISKAIDICGALPPFITTVGLFVDADASDIQAILSEVPIDLLQFHGEESPAYCLQFGKPYLKAVRMKPDLNLVQYAAIYKSAKALLLDTYMPGKPGGTGATFDWSLIPKQLPLPIVLSGGLTPANIGEAVKTVRSWAVDVSSGVEASPGIKDAVKISEFIKGIHDSV